MDEIPNNVQTTMLVLKTRMQEEMAECHRLMSLYLDTCHTLRYLYSPLDYDQLHHERAMPWLDMAKQHSAMYKQLHDDYEALKQFPWGQQEP